MSTAECFSIFGRSFIAERASRAPWVSKSTHPRKFGNHVTVHRTTVRPHHRHTNEKFAVVCECSESFGSWERGFFGAKTNGHRVLWSIKPGFHMIVPIVWTCFETTGTIRKIRTIIWKQGLNNLEVQRSQLRTKRIFFFCISWQKLFLHSYFLEFSFILSSSLEYREREAEKTGK